MATSSDTWAARLDVEAMLVDYLAALDDRRFEDAAACFTDDGVLQFEEVRLVGPAVIVEAMRRQLGTLDRTHHTVTNVRVGLDGDAATLTAQAIGAHLWTEEGNPRQSVLGGSYRATLARTDQGWRLTLLAPSFVWTVGDVWEH